MTTIKWRRDTASAWTAANPVLAEGEAGFETNTGKAKVGNGTTAWNSLPYFGGGNERVVQTITAPTTLAAGANTDYVYFLSSVAGSGDQFLSNVVVLLNGNGANNSTSITDSGPLNKTVTVGGAARISTTQSKFGGASMYFPGANADRLTLAASSDYVMGSSDFCVEGWVYRQSGSGGYARAIHFGPTWNSNDAWGIVAGHADHANKIVFASFKLGFSLKSAAAIVNDTWYHVAGVRSGNVFTLYVNGVAQESATVSGTIESSSTNYVSIGGAPSQISGENFAGYIDDVRITKNARYAANFTAPTGQLPNTYTAPTFGTPTLPTAVGNSNQYTLKNITTGSITVGTTSSQTFDIGDPFSSSVALLLNGNGANGSTVFSDSSLSPKTVTRLGTPTISTAQSKFGGASMFFSNNGLQISNPQTAFNGPWSGDFTIEAWTRPTSVPTSQGSGAERVVLGQIQWPDASGWMFYYDQNRLCMFINNSQVVGTVTGNWQADTWYHVATTRSGSTVRVFLNGIQLASGTNTNPIFNTNTLPATIATDTGGDTTFLPGYLDDLRVSSIARYTGDFTPPTSELTIGNSPTTTVAPLSTLRVISDGSNWRTV